ncbi:phosphohistidine phosphatase [Reichenbachiella faecimaris]|uniref:Phosphohistidine phosphatase n=1 Tax=Reichenbachiella faecimaris TaxID=692418 RepID=A0A1W2G8C0_REIFA|nr:histidine phosphatase family protein [Reichenbachiella faecimaris]SMD32578.1 phosphohistidine phosphatase [Reichenbachiella faecimaris]
MKTLYLVRHAKSSWKDTSLRDRDRPLNKRGKRDAPRMAEFLKEKMACPDTFISSPSRRTQDTAVNFLHAFGLLKSDLKLEEGLFHGDERDIESVIHSLSNDHQSAVLFIHNPGITDYANELTNEDIFNIPTSGVVGIQLETDDWKQINQCRAKKLFYYYPKGLDLPTL